MSPDEPPLPPYSFKAAEDLRLKIRDDGFRGLIDAPCEGTEFACLLDAMDRVLGVGKVDPEVLIRTVQSHLLGMTLSWPVIDRFARRVAGNMPRLRGGEPLYPYTAQHDCEWVPWRVIDGIKALDSRGRPGFEYGFVALAGTPTGVEVRRFWRRELIFVVARKLGFSNRRGQLPLDHPAMLVGCIFYGLVDPTLSTGNRPGFHRIACTGTMEAANKRLLRMRHRRDWQCPRGYRHPCHRCSIGYALPAQSQCPAATHPRMYAVGRCPACGNAKAIFDPARDRDRCLSCIERARCHKDR